MNCHRRYGVNIRSLRIGFPELVVAALILLGVLLRLLQYTYNGSLWLDEAMLALNVLKRSFAQLLEPLDYGQAAPSAFLLATKGGTLLLGTSEYALRVLPMIAGIAALPLLFLAARRFGEVTAAVAVALVALSSHLIWHSAEFKQYSVDLAIAIILILAAFRACERDALDPRGAARLAGLGALGLWFSHPSVFVLAGIGGALGMRLLRERDWRSLRRLTLVTGAWVGSFALAYLIVLRRIDRTPFQEYWQAWFLPLPPQNLAELLDWAEKLRAALGNPLGLDLVYAGGVLLLLGSFMLIRTRRDLSLVLILPVAFALIAAGLELYPFARRLILFTVPSMAILVAHGAGSIWQQARSGGARFLILVVILVMLWGPANAAMSVPFRREELRPVVAYLEDRHRNGDAIYVYFGALPAFRYYTRDGGLADAEVYDGARVTEALGPDRADLDRLLGKERVWVVFSHVHGRGADSDEAVILSQLDEIGARRDSIRGPGVAVFLYDLRVREAAR